MSDHPETAELVKQCCASCERFRIDAVMAGLPVYPHIPAHLEANRQAPPVPKSVRLK